MADKIILFDGVCNLCNSSVNFIIDHDKKDVFRFASLQSEAGQEILETNKLSTKEFKSIIFSDNGKIYTQSSAVLRIVKDFPGLWKLFYGFIIVPPVIRNYFYDIIADNRYRWFGKKDSCRIPTPELRNKFL
ncbi:MAG TPA: thiol-disulfide oxidoreductase DCC family protein [Ignavibacteria bacterium]|nr:thiol-disulfide oxidoreductase DCC family protein [Ignavibacteria bacterium]HMR40457.1 thiol-disulfide oxidoreductase DCC family protein [Ignavibacteria bacterium]